MFQLYLDSASEESSSKAAVAPSRTSNHLQKRILELEAQLARKEILARKGVALKEQAIQSLQEIQDRTEQLEQANHRLELANTEIKLQGKTLLKHFACMSHEIRTPLNCIVGMSSLLLDTPLNQFQQEAVSMITSSGDLLSTVVDDVLDYSKLESGDFSIDIQRVDLQTTMDSVATSLQMKSDKAGLGLWIRLYVGINVPQFCLTDGKRLQQILVSRVVALRLCCMLGVV
jgi:signal transduction histidine kinase